MINLANKKLRLGLLALVCVLVAAALPAAVIGRPKLAPATQASTLVCTYGPTFNLKASDGYVTMPDGNQIYMWSYSETANPFQLPGPVLCVNEGDTVTITLTNTLPADPVSIIFPGQNNVVPSGGSAGLLTAEAASGGGSVTYTFVAGNPGTYLYQSGTDMHKQVQMGLYGALVVYPAIDTATEKYAYDDPATQYDPNREYLLLLHDMDPKLHAVVERGEPYDITTKHDRYWTINGRAFPDIIADNFAPWLPSQPYGAMVVIEASPDENALPALIRYVNAGMENHPFHPHGNNMIVIGRDGRQLDQTYENFTTTIGSGQTYDLFFRWIDVDAWQKPNLPGDPGNPVPVLVPGNLNLVFKDGASFYSGDPYLGAKGDFPPGVTVYNECGEFYFPWHSHALNEIQNFDEGFGGMLTLVRVNPPGGCP